MFIITPFPCQSASGFITRGNLKSFIDVSEKSEKSSFDIYVDFAIGNQFLHSTSYVRPLSRQSLYPRAVFHQKSVLLKSTCLFQDDI